MLVPWRMVARDSGATVADSLELADSFWSRLLGWQFRAPPPTAGHGLLLVPCGSVHTCWMRFTIDVVMIDRTGTVLAVRPRVRPWRIVTAPRGTHAVLELPSDIATIGVGQALAIVGPADHSPPPAAMRFLARE